MRELGLGIETQFGCYRLERAKASWLDWEAAANAIDEAEGALRAGEPRKAWGPANITVSIGKRGFLTGEHGAWVEARRHELDELLIRRLTAYAEIGLDTGQTEPAVQASKEAVALEPFRELGYQHLMRAHSELGNRAEALRALSSLPRASQRRAGRRPVAADRSGLSEDPESRMITRGLW